MKIFICVPEHDSSRQQELSIRLCESLRKFYGDINLSDIEFFTGSKRTVYIMNKSLRDGSDSEIIRIIRGLIGSDSDVKLNYSRINPNFRPQVPDSDSDSDSDLNSSSEKDSHNHNHDKDNEFDYKKLSLNYHAEEPRYTFEQVILPEDTLKRIQEAADMISPEVRQIVFDDWGLSSIVPHAASAMSFYGPPGTGKTMAAEAVANYLGKKIIRASYADIESKYHGEGPKMVKAIFMAAAREDAVLFIDESDSLLSKRLTNVTDGSVQAINSMRSQLLISLEQFNGVVIFATNLVVNYDKAFLSRLISIEFPMPDLNARKYIWQKHLHGESMNIPFDVNDSVNIDELAEKYKSFCGREIKNSVIYACVSEAVKVRRGEAKREDIKLTHEDIINACEKVKLEAEQVLKSSDHTESRKLKLTDDENKELTSVMQNELDKRNQNNNSPDSN